MDNLGSSDDYLGSKTHSLGSNHVRLSFEKWQKTNKKGDKIKKEMRPLPNTKVNSKRLCKGTASGCPKEL